MSMSSLVAQLVKNLPANAGEPRDAGSIPGSGRSPGGGQGNPLQYSCLKNSMDRGAWWAMVRKFTKSQTWLKWLSMHIHNLPLSLMQLFLGPYSLFVFCCLRRWLSRCKHYSKGPQVLACLTFSVPRTLPSVCSWAKPSNTKPAFQ